MQEETGPLWVALGHVCIEEQTPPQVLAGLSLLPCSLCIFYSVHSSLLGPPPYRTTLPSIGPSDLWGGGTLSSGSIKTSWLTHSHGQWCLGKDFRGSSWDHLSARLALMLPPTPRS